MLIILNFILKALNALREERDMIGFDCNVENILEKERVESCSNSGERKQKLDPGRGVGRITL